MSFPHKIFELATKVRLSSPSMSTMEKIPRLIKKIGTHNGVFHCDDALACFMLKQLPEYKDAEIVRTRNPDVLATCDIVVDVGGEYNPKTHRYDHHQRGFTETLSTVRPDLAKNKQIKLSSAGLVYVHFGFEIVRNILDSHGHKERKEGLACIFMTVYEELVEELDAVDNGIPMYDEGTPKYRINTHLSARVHKLNPEWNVPDEECDFDGLFTKAMQLVGSEFTQQVLTTATVWYPARAIVRQAIEKRKEVDQSGEIILLEEKCPWKEHLLQLEEEMDLVGQIKFALYHDKTGTWRVQGIPITADSFICRVFLHEDWRGVRDEQLLNVSGIAGCVFCHSTGFIGGNATKEGALQMALDSLKAVKNSAV